MAESVLSPIQLSPSHTGLFKAADIAPGALEECNKLLMKNHEAYHIYYRDPAFHNHMAHSLLTTLTLGATTSELQDRWNDLTPIQRAIPQIDEELLAKLDDDDAFYATIGTIDQYHTYLEFFKRKIAAAGGKYETVVLKYCFSHSKVADRMLAQLVEGAYHPIIHLGFGVEFQQPTIVAEALAMAASHDRMNIEEVLFAAERTTANADANAKPVPLIQLVHEARANETIRHAAKWTDGPRKMTDGVVGRAGSAMAALAAKFQIRHDSETDLARRTAEMISVCAFVAGAAQEPGRAQKIDFFVMHSVTSSIFCSVLAGATFIPLAERARLVEYKARVDLMWYAATGCAALDETAVASYSNKNSDGLGWDELFRDVRRECDDGHAAKYIRALKNGEMVAATWEKSEEWRDYFPCRGDMWLRSARLCQDTTTKTPWELKWVFFAGFPQPWARPDLADPLNRIAKPVEVAA